MIRDYQAAGTPCARRSSAPRAWTAASGTIMPTSPTRASIDTFHDYEPCILARYLKEIPEFYTQLDDAFIDEHGSDRPL